MEENDINKELNEIGILINKGGTAGIYKVISKLTSTQNPILEQAIENMILQAAKKPNSPYSLVVDKDGTINYNATAKISQISNPTDFIKNLDEMEEKGIPFSEAVVEEIITDEIQAEIAEIESLANDNSEMSVEEAEARQREIEAKSGEIESKLTGIAKLGAGATVLSILGRVRQRVTTTIGGFFSKIFKKKDDAKVKNEKAKDEQKLNLGKSAANDTNNITNQKENGKDIVSEEKKDAPKKSRDEMTLDEKIAEEAKDNPWIIPELRKGVQMKDGVEVKYNPVELKMEKNAAQASDDLPGDIDDGPGSSDSENDFDDDFR